MSILAVAIASLARAFPEDGLSIEWVAVGPDDEASAEAREEGGWYRLSCASEEVFDDDVDYGVARLAAALAAVCIEKGAELTALGKVCSDIEMALATS